METPTIEVQYNELCSAVWNASEEAGYDWETGDIDEMLRRVEYLKRKRLILIFPQLLPGP